MHFLKIVQKLPRSFLVGQQNVYVIFNKLGKKNVYVIFNNDNTIQFDSRTVCKLYSENPDIFKDP